MLVTLTALCCALGCKSTRDSECRNFVYAVNSRLGDIDRLTQQRPDGQRINAGEMRHLAELYQNLADKTDQLSIDQPELRTLREQYRAMVYDAARLARSIAESLDKKDIEAAMKAHSQFSAVVSREDELVTRVNAFCRQPQ
ncbi:MAG TPA: hypothetical protein VIV60_09115 [Polyangiaceae bacterium]